MTGEASIKVLRELRIKDFAIIDDLALSFGEGLSVLTGETGAGKSILVGALGLALGERASADMIKSGADEASVEAFFDMPGHPALEQMGIDAAEGIIIRRLVSASGRSRAYVNGTMVTLQALSELGNGLVDLHGQHEHQSLLSTENQMRLLDHFGGLDGERAEVASLFSEVQELRRRIGELRQGERERAQRLDLLKHQAGEIDAASVTPGEDEVLSRERAVLSNLSRLNELLHSSYGLLYESEGSITERLSSVRSMLEEMVSVDGDVSGALGVLGEAVPLLEDVALSLRGLKDRYDMDPARLSVVDDRVRLLTDLKKKYGDTLEDVLAYAGRAREEAETLETADETAGALEGELRGKEGRLTRAYAHLTEKRKEAARKLSALIKEALSDLALEKSDFVVDVREAPAAATGADEVVFLFTAHKSESQPKPLAKVASGGELSRVMLAIKGVLRAEDDIPVLVFDEVDAGIGGRTAHSVARRLKALSRGRQVLCITHLPQIASEADRHFLIEKKSRGERVYVKVMEVAGDRREEEIARMLGGRVTDASLKHAREMIRGA